MKFAAADRASGSRKTTNGPADADSEKVADQDCSEDYDGNESERLVIQLGYTGVGSRLVQAALRDYRPVHFGKCTIRANHFHGAIFLFGGEANGLSVPQFLGQSANLGD